MKEIILTSRYNDEYKLIQVEDNLYRADFGKMYEWVRFGGSGINNSYDYVDPPGGPFLHIGDKVNNKIIKSIKINNGIFIEFENETNN